MALPDWETLRSECASCTACGLSQGRHNVVFGTGPEDANVLFVGEGPGEQEDLRGEPFVGPAGRLLDDLLMSVGLARSEVYIANIVKCRPPGNRDPHADEQDACIGYLRMQTALLRPKIIVALGRIAAMRLISPDFKITRQHGQWFDRKNVRMTATYHPSALLRDPSKRPEAFLDFKALATEAARLCKQTGE